MIDGSIRVLTYISILGCALVSGIFFAFSTFIMKGLERIPTQQGIAAMQSINVTVINPWFMAVFFGTAIVCLYLVVISIIHWGEPGSGHVLLGGALYLIGTILITIAFNVPRNDALATLDVASHEGAMYWAEYLKSWTFWNHIRTVAALAAAVAFISSLRN